MTIKELFEIIVNKYNAACYDYVKNQTEKLEGQLEAYCDIICLIEHNEGFEHEKKNIC